LRGKTFKDKSPGEEDRKDDNRRKQQRKTTGNYDKPKPKMIKTK